MDSTALRGRRGAPPRGRRSAVVSAVVLLAAVVGAGTLLWALSHATAQRGLAEIGGGVLAAALLVAAAEALITRRGRSAHWVALGLALAVVAAAANTSAPLRARWALSASAFERVLPSLPSTVGSSWQQPGRAAAPATLGLYRVRAVDVVPAGYLFQDADAGDLTGTGLAGFAYLPQGPASVPVDEQLNLTSLGRGWYAFWQSA
jgi:hypothetical protein